MKKVSTKELVANDGCDAALRGESRKGNPHVVATLRDWWDLGWLEGSKIVPESVTNDAH